MKGKLARKAVKSTAKREARSATAKLQRKPLRTTTLLAIGVVAGMIIGVLVGRATDGGAPTVTDGGAPTVSGLTTENGAYEPGGSRPQQPTDASGDTPEVS